MVEGKQEFTITNYPEPDDDDEEVKGELCDVARSLETELVKIGAIEESQEIFGKPFPLVLVPRGGEHVNFV